MDADDEKKEEKFDPQGQFIKDYIKFLSEEEGFDYEDFLKKYEESPEISEFSELVKEFNEAEDKDKVKNKIKAFEYKMKYKNTKYKIPVCEEENYKQFISNLENLIEAGINKDSNKALELIYNYILLIIPTLNKDRRTPSDIAVGALTKDTFEEWVKNRIDELKGQPVDNIRYKIKKNLFNFDLPFWKEQKNLKKIMFEEEEVIRKDAETLVNDVEAYYEAFRLVCGMLIGLFDLLEDKYDNNLEESYYGDKFNTDLGFYSRRKKQVGNRLLNDPRPTLKDYFEKYNFSGFQDFFHWLMNSVKPIRLTGAHHQAVIEQDKISEGNYKIKYRDGIKDTHIGYLDACSVSIASFITLIFWVAYHYLLLNV